MSPDGVSTKITNGRRGVLRRRAVAGHENRKVDVKPRKPSKNGLGVDQVLRKVVAVEYVACPKELKQRQNNL